MASSLQRMPSLSILFCLYCLCLYCCSPTLLSSYSLISFDYLLIWLGGWGWVAHSLSRKFGLFFHRPHSFVVGVVIVLYSTTTTSINQSIIKSQSFFMLVFGLWMYVRDYSFPITCFVVVLMSKCYQEILYR